MQAKTRMASVVSSMLPARSATRSVAGEPVRRSLIRSIRPTPRVQHDSSFPWQSLIPFAAGSVAAAIGLERPFHDSLPSMFAGMLRFWTRAGLMRVSSQHVCAPGTYSIRIRALLPHLSLSHRGRLLSLTFGDGQGRLGVAYLTGLHSLARMRFPTETTDDHHTNQGRNGCRQRLVWHLSCHRRFPLAVA